MPQAFIAISEAAGIPNDGDMHILERVHLAKPNVLYNNLEITAPKVLSATWKTTRIFRRYPERHYEVIEGECAQEDLIPGQGPVRQRHICRKPPRPVRFGPYREIRMIVMSAGNAFCLLRACCWGLRGFATAHHSNAAYDVDHPKTMEGTVKTVNWTNPHITFVVEKEAKDEEPAGTWVFEVSSPGVLTRSGWTKRSLSPEIMRCSAMRRCVTAAPAGS